ncbi:MAG: hypothetical protein ACWA5A_01610 [Marinibacterium sp.]
MRTIMTGSDTRDDTLVASATIRETLKGLGGDDTFIFYDGPQPFFDRDFSDRFIGGAGNDVMTGLNVGFFDYTTYDQLSFDGGRGYDTVVYNVSDTIADADKIDMELGEFRTLERSVEAHAFNINATVVDGSTASFSILGDAGDEVVALTLSPTRAQQLESTIDMSIDLGDGDDTVSFVGQQRIDTVLKIDTGTGNDVVIVNDTTTENSKVSKTVINTGGGADTVVLEGMHKETVKVGAGSDIVYVLTGNFADVSDKIITGGGKDQIFLELDEYSKIARITDFDASKDVLVFDEAETRNTTVTFDKAVADAATQPMLYMDNAAGELYFGGNLLVDFTNGAVLTDLNFTTDTFLF